MVLHAASKDGRYVIDEPADLPVSAMDAEERGALMASIERGLAQVDRGKGIPAEEALRRLRAGK